MATVTMSQALQPKAQAASTETPIADSSWLAKIAFKDGFLEMTTKRGDVYRQFNPLMGPSLYEQWRQAPSKGRFWNDVIKKQGPSLQTISKSTGAPARNPARGPVIKHENGRSHVRGK